MNIIERIEENEKILQSLSDENKIKLTMVKIDLEDLLTIDNNILEIELYETEKNTVGIYNEFNILGVDIEIMFLTENAGLQLAEICDTLNRLPFCEAHFDSDQIEVAILDNEDWVQVTLYIVINADYVLTDYDEEWFDIENMYIYKNASYSSRYEILDII